MDTATSSNMDGRELSPEELLASFLTDEKLNDVTLRGKDGITVSANRYILAAKTKVFHRMLFGQFRESSSDEVNIGFPGHVIKAVVEYIHTRSPEILDHTKIQKPDDTDATNANQQVSFLISLAAAASFFNLPQLEKAVAETLCHLLTNWPTLSFAMLEAMISEGPSIQAELFRKVFHCIQTNTTIFAELKPSHVGCLTPAVLEKILANPGMHATEYQLFQLLMTWVDASSDSMGNQDRLDVASGLSKHLNLAKINPRELSTIVSESGFIANEQIFEAYKIQALAAEDGSGLPDFTEPRLVVQWITSMPETPPEEIKVEGAGTAEINGVYKRSTNVDEAGEYTMSGNDANKPHVFRIKGFNARRWYLFTGAPGPRYFYSHDNLVRRRDIPPSTQWERCGDGADPPPRLLYKAIPPANPFTAVYTSDEE